MIDKFVSIETWRTCIWTTVSILGSQRAVTSLRRKYPWKIPSTLSAEIQYISVINLTVIFLLYKALLRTKLVSYLVTIVHISRIFSLALNLVTTEQVTQYLYKFHALYKSNLKQFYFTNFDSITTSRKKNRTYPK